MRLKLALFIGFSGLLAYSCRTPKAEDTSSPEGVGLPTEEGIPITFVSDLPAQVGHEIFKNLGFLAAAGNPDGLYKNIRPIDIGITCEAVSQTENHCRMVYDGPEMRLKLADLLFRSMSGQVFVRRGCKGQGCEKPPLKMWWRTLAKSLPSGQRGYDFEVCDIRGLEAGVSVNTPFALGNQLLEKINFKPDIRGFKASIIETEVQVPTTDDQGRELTGSDGKPKLEKMMAFKPTGVQAGFGPLGEFPNNNCLLKSNHEEAFFKNLKTPKDGKDLPLPADILEQVPGNFIRFGVDVIGHMAAESRGEALKINLRCQDTPNKPVCEIRYRGPQVTIPVPKYITGIFDGEVQVLRKCENPGCVQATEAIVRMSTYKTDQYETIEMCSTSGMELTTLKKLPHQSRIVGAPDIKGLILRIDPGTPPKESDEKDPRIASSATLKSTHVGFTGIGRYPTTRCLFVEE